MKYILILLVIVLASCDVNNINFISSSDRNVATISMFWQRNTEEVTKKCNSLGLTYSANGCARSNPTNINICEVYVVEPANFDDKTRLAILGHEVWHCFGAKHK